ncbi:MAG TPA: hydrogenase maturation protease [Acidimicrobiales bacterium]|nr:hydrogenase maturation protease [Acidimicrobiales bacterium]
MKRVVVGGIGNIFLGDDGFGVEVAQRLAGASLPPEVTVVDVGIRGLHLAFDLLEGCETLILVDAMATGGAPGTVVVLEPDPTGSDGAAALDAHSIDPQAVLAMVADMGGTIGRVLVVGCQPASLEEGIGLSPPVTAAVPAAVETVISLVQEACAHAGREMQYHPPTHSMRGDRHVPRHPWPAG